MIFKLLLIDVNSHLFTTFCIKIQPWPNVKKMNNLKFDHAVIKQNPPIGT